MFVSARSFFIIGSMSQLVECMVVLVSVTQSLRNVATTPRFASSTCETGTETILTRPITTTERLELRPMNPHHLALHRQLDTDPEVMRYPLGRSRTPEETDEFWAPRCADTIADAAGIGWWVGFVGDCFVGWWDLGRSDSDPAVSVKPGEAEIGWRVLRSHWGAGAGAGRRHRSAAARFRNCPAETGLGRDDGGECPVETSHGEDRNAAHRNRDPTVG